MTSPVDLKTVILPYQKAYLKYLESNNLNQSPTNLYEPVNYIMQLGGKRLRPVLALMATELFDNDYTKTLPVSHAVEIFHNFSLVHDDIMDQAPIRRGKPSVHIKYDTNTAILSGDVMLIYAYEYLLKYREHPNFAKIVEVFNRVAIHVCEGQQYDMDFEKRNDVTIPEYEKMIGLKTAALISGALEMGALVAEAAR